MFGALLRMFRRNSRLRSVGVYYVGHSYHVVTQYGSDGGDPCVEVGPVASIERPDDPTQLGQAIRHGLAQCRYDYPFPKNREAWKSVPLPLLAATGLKTWAAVAKRANNLRVDQEDSIVRIRASRRDKQSFYPVPEREIVLESPTDLALGQAVVTELDFARINEGPE
jgi:hypothetical protein